jgi:hypothetical protein
VNLVSDVVVVVPKLRYAISMADIIIAVVEAKEAVVAVIADVIP